ncbi:MAG: cupin domain-containing protein [Terracidiphilus sp.]
MSLLEKIFSPAALAPIAGTPPGVRLVSFASNQCGATGFSTGLATFQPGSRLPYHTHPCSEAVTILQGQAEVEIEGRRYRLGPLDCAHFPAGVAHQVTNADSELELIAHTAFASAQPTRDLTDTLFAVQDRGPGNPLEGDPETILRFDQTPVYELSENAFFSDLFARRLGAVGICGGYGRFLSGASLPCHIHDYDESITIVGGAAVSLVQGRQYQLSGYETAFIPRGIPHRFINQSKEEMAMIWVYAGDEPDRTIVDAGYCSGAFSSPVVPLEAHSG